ncbi:MAG: glycosyltransferase family 4 protein, partial [Lactococcus lactis]|nr:glycosyltransferase family 4 protein [Lactococcus lactis]
SLLTKLPSIESDDFYTLNLQQKKDLILELYLSNGVREIDSYFNQRQGFLIGLKYSEYMLLAAGVIYERSIEDSLKLTRLAFENAKTSRHYVDILEFCSAHHLDLGAELIQKVETVVDLSQPENKQLKDFIDNSPLKAKLIEKLLVINNNSYEFYEPVKNRICYILHNSLPYASGGYATRAHGVANGLAGLGFEVFGINRPGYPLDINKKLKKESIDTASKVDNVTYLHTNSPKRKSLYRYDYMQESIKIYENYFLELKPEAVVAASAYISAFPALIAAKKLGIPFVYEVRGFWEVTLMSRDLSYRDTDKFFMMKGLETKIAEVADKVWTLTNAMKTELKDRGIQSDKVSVIPNSCFPEKLTPQGRDKDLADSLRIPEDIPVIGYIGTFVDYEGLENLTKACGLLKTRGIEFRLMLVGSENTSSRDKGPIRSLIETYAEQYDISDWLILPGRVPHEQVEKYYSLIDIAPFPRKPWPVCEMVSPMKPLEALAMKKAVVVSSVDALQEMVIDGQTGLVFDKNSTDDLADQLQRLITDSNLRVQLGNNGREWVEENRSWAVTMTKAKNVLNDLLN